MRALINPSTRSDLTDILLCSRWLIKRFVSNVRRSLN